MTSAPAAEPTPRASAGWRDYVSLAKPGITALIVTVAVAGYLLAAPTSVHWTALAILLLTGASASAGAAMLNHYLDRDLDAVMRRTRDRPIPSERIDPSRNVALLGFLFSGVGVLGSAILLNPLTGFSILLGGLTYVVVYTIWLKRRSSWNIVIGGFAGSAPALAGSAAATGTWTPGVLAFALLVFLWTPPHFWSLAMLLRDDYRRVGLPMLPRMDDPAYSGRVIVVSAILLLPATVLVGVFAPLTLPVFVAFLALGALFVALTAPLWRAPDRAVARRGFIYSGPYLLLLVVLVVVNAALIAFGLPSGLHTAGTVFPTTG